MSAELRSLQNAPERKVMMYKPYYKNSSQQVALSKAISLCERGNLEGERKIEGSQNVPFIATWNVSSLPADRVRCRVQFDNNADLTYETTMANYELVNHLIEVLLIFQKYRVADFSKSFYRKLLSVDD